MPKGCKEPGCTAEHYSRGYCWQHYRKYRESGDLKVERRPRNVPKDDVPWSQKPARTRTEVAELMVKRAYEFLDDPKSTKEAVLTVMRIVGRWEQKVEDPGILEELKSLQGKVHGMTVIHGELEG